ncbi:MAG: TraM recognition domain-containing protein [Bacteroidales bacterium]|nr:TraM recognition domain-containing protein [Bacteroidales bacterium]
MLQYARSLNVKLVAALQNTYQLKQKYGEAEAMNILSGFSTVIAHLCIHLCR